MSAEKRVGLIYDSLQEIVSEEIKELPTDELTVTKDKFADFLLFKAEVEVKIAELAQSQS